MAPPAGTGLADTVRMVMRRGIIQLSTPDELRGRVTSANMIVVPSGPRLGQPESGAVAVVIAAAVPAIRKYTT